MHHPPDPLRYAVLLESRPLRRWQARCLERLNAVEGVRPAAVLLRGGDGGDAATASDARTVSGRVRADGSPSTGQSAARGERGASGEGAARDGGKTSGRIGPALRRRAWRMLRRRLAPDVGALEPVELRTVLPDTPVVEIGPEASAGPDLIPDGPPDLVLHLGGGAVAASLLELPRFGVWTFRHGSRAPGRGRRSGRRLPLGAEEIVRGDAVVEAALERLDGDPRRREVLHRGRFRVIDDSWRQTRDAVLLGAADFPARVCREILVSGAPAATPVRLRAPADEGAEAGSPDAADGSSPSVGNALLLAGVLARNYVRNVVSELLRHEQWTIGVVPRPPEAVLEADERLWIRWMPCPSRRFYRADPFGVEEDGVLRILVEEFDYRERRGRLVSVAATLDGRPRAPGRSAPDPSDGGGADPRDGAGADPRRRGGMSPRRGGGPESRRRDGGSPGRTGPEGHDAEPVGLPWQEDGDTHVSYPFLFRHEGDTYCVPETAEAGAARLYRARHFPAEWDVVATLVEDFPALDPTVFRHGGRWWLLCTDGGTSGGQYRLHGWWSRRLTGPWTPHPLNPLKTDVRSTRPAGTPFHHKGGLYRPAQDGSRGYGSGLALNRVLELTPSRFREATVAYLAPDPDGPFPDGLHTLSGVGDRTLVDGQRRVFIASEFRRLAGRRLRALAGRLLPELSDRLPDLFRRLPDLSRSRARGSTPRPAPAGSDGGGSTHDEPSGASS